MRLPLTPTVARPTLDVLYETQYPTLHYSLTLTALEHA